MGKSKLERFEEIARFENILELTDFQSEDSEKPKGNWNAEIFANDNPITLELACGKGNYTLELARRYPGHNFTGIDIKGARLWHGAQKALNENLENVRFLRIYIDHLDEYYDVSEVDEIWITFPDPYPRFGDRNKRLSNSKFLELYQKVLKPGAPVHFKTDSGKLFSYTKESVSNYGCNILDLTEDIYRERPDDELLTIKTDYEKRHLEEGKSIKYMRFTLPD